MHRAAVFVFVAATSLLAASKGAGAQDSWEGGAWMMDGQGDPTATPSSDSWTPSPQPTSWTPPASPWTPPASPWTPPAAAPWTPSPKAAVAAPVNCAGWWSGWENPCTTSPIDPQNDGSCKTYRITQQPANGGLPCPHVNGEKDCRKCQKQVWRCQDAYRFSTVGQVPFKVIKKIPAEEQPNGAHCQRLVDHYVRNYAKNHIQALVGSSNGPPQGGPEGAIFGPPRSTRGTDIGNIVFPTGASPPQGDFIRAFVNSVYYYVRLACSSNVVRCGGGEISGSGSCSVQLTSVEPFCTKRQEFTPWVQG